MLETSFEVRSAIRPPVNWRARGSCFCRVDMSRSAGRRPGRPVGSCVCMSIRQPKYRTHLLALRRVPRPARACGEVTAIARAVRCRRLRVRRTSRSTLDGVARRDDRARRPSSPEDHDRCACPPPPCPCSAPLSTRAVRVAATAGAPVGSDRCVLRLLVFVMGLTVGRHSSTGGTGRPTHRSPQHEGSGHPGLTAPGPAALET